MNAINHTEHATLQRAIEPTKPAVATMPCDCDGYTFAHVQRNGICKAHTYGPFCGECEQPCKWDGWSEEDDDGRSYPVFASKCCGAAVFDCPELVTEWEPKHDDDFEPAERHTPAYMYDASDCRWG